MEEKLTAYFEEAVSDTMPRWWGNVARKHVVQCATNHAKEEFMEVMKKGGKTTQRFSLVP